MSAEPSRRVLFVVDEEHTRDAMQRLLTGLGYECVTCGDAASGAELLKCSRFDLAIVDLVIPGKSGIEFLRDIKASDPSIGVLILSAFASTDSVVEAMRLGADDYLTKPVQLAELRERVRSALQRRDERHRPTPAQAEGVGLSTRSSTGIERLDQMLGGGLPQQSLVAVAGAPGTGKTILVLHTLAEAVRRGHCALYVTTTHQPVTKMRDRYGDLSFLKPAGLIDQIEFLELQPHLQSHDLSEVMNVIVQRLQEEKTAVVAVDSFRAISDAAPNRIGIRRFLGEMGHQLIVSGSVGIVVGEYGLPQALDLPEFAMADLVIYLGIERQRSADLRSLQIFKHRGTNYEEGASPFVITGDGIHFSA